MTRISVVIPIYNTAAYLDRCMRSVLGQTHSDLEIILVDDGSTDESPKLCDRYAALDTRVRVIHQPNGGASRARNAALELVSGDYIAFVDSDDWIEPDMYAYLLGLIEQTGADVAEATHEVAYSENHRMRSVTERIEVFSGEDILVRYFIHNEFGMWLRLYAAEVFADVRFDEGRITEDVVAGFLALRNARTLVTSNRPLVYYYSNPAGISESPLRKRDLDLLFAGERLDLLTEGTTNSELRRLALTKKYRSSFTLLVKLAVFGCSDEVDESAVTRELRVAIREHYGFLMSSNMPLNRKLILTGCRFCYPLVRLAARCYHFLVRRRG